MIQTLLLIFDAGASWQKIAKAQRGILFILLRHLVPLLVISLGVEAYAMTRLGEASGVTGHKLVVSERLAVRYAVTAAALYLVVVFFGGKLLQRLAASFHNQIAYPACFTTAAYGISPVILLHLPDALPGLPTWVCFVLGAALAASSLYHAVPQLLKPDPVKAMQLYLVSVILLLGLAGVVHFVSIEVLHDQIDYRFWEQFLR